MKNKERIEQLEKQLQVLINRVALLEMKTAVKTFPPQTPPASPPLPTTWPTYPRWTEPTWKPNTTEQYVLCSNPAHLIQ